METPIRHRGRLAAILSVAVGLAVLMPGDSSLAQEERAEVLPLAPGNSWTYAGTVWWVPRNSRRVLEERVRLEMRVVEVTERPGAKAALLAGYPPDLVTTVPDRLDGEFVLLQIGPAVYLLRGQRAREALRRVADPSDPLADLLAGSEVVLDAPLDAGKSFCSPRDVSRTGPGTCWFVRDAGPIQQVPGVALDRAVARRGFVLALESRTEHEVRGFVPGVGFTSFAIGHYGDPSALEVELINARLAPPPGHARGLFLKTLDLSDERRLEMATATNRSVEPAPERAAVEKPARTAPRPAGRREVERRQAEPAPVEPAPAPFPSAEPLLPDRRVVETGRPAEPVGIAVASVPLPVPVWEEETRPACLDDRDWYVGGEPIMIDGRQYDPVGSAEPIDPANLVPSGEYDGVPAFAGRLSPPPYTSLWLPLCATPGSYRLYADLGAG